MNGVSRCLEWERIGWGQVGRGQLTTALGELHHDRVATLSGFRERHVPAQRNGLGRDAKLHPSFLVNSLLML